MTTIRKNKNIYLKSTYIPNKVPTVDEIAYRELFLNVKDGKLFYKNLNDEIIYCVTNKDIESLINSLGWDKISDTPTTLAGYGILDAAPIISPTFSGEVLINGNLTVSGTTTTFNSTNITIEDTIFNLGGNSDLISDDAKDRGISFRWFDDSSKIGFFGFDRSSNKFIFIPEAIFTNDVVSGTKGELDVNIAWSNILSIPTTLAGFGILDAAPLSHISDNNLHLTPTQNSYLLNLSSNIQSQLNNKQPLNANLTSIIALPGTGLLRKVDAETWSLDSNIYLTQNQNITVSGDIAGSGNTNITLTLPNIVTQNTHTKITYNAKGLITSGENLGAGDIPSLSWTKITSDIPTTLAGYGILDGAPLSHLDDDSRHLTSAQNSWLDSILSSDNNLSFSPVWNDAPTVFTALKINVTDTASSSGSLLADFQVGGTSRLKLTKGSVNGSIKTILYLYSGNGNSTTLSAGQANDLHINGCSACRDIYGTSFNSAVPIGFGGNFGTNPFDSSFDVKLYRDAAATLAQRNSTNAQTYRIYNTYTDSSNYERLSIGWNSNVISIGPEALGTGVVRPLSFNFGTITTDAPLSINQTWNNSLTTFTGLKVNVTDTASNASSKIFDIQLAGVSKLGVTKYGDINILGSIISNANPGNKITFYPDGANHSFSIAYAGFINRHDHYIGWTQNRSYDGITDVALYRDGSSGILAQRYTTTAQTFRIYNTYTDASNYERASLGWSTNTFSINSEAAGTGSIRAINFNLGTVVADTPLTINQTWNNAAVAFTGLKLNVTDTASATGSNLLDLQVGGTSKFKVLKTPEIILGSSRITLTSGIISFGNPADYGDSIKCGQVVLGNAFNNASISSQIGISLGKYGSNWLPLSWKTSVYYDSAILTLIPDAADILAQRNSTNAQTYRIYNTYTDASNYERASLGWSTNTFSINSEAAGTGSIRAINFNLGTVVADSPLTINQTWNNAAVSFTGLNLNIIGTTYANLSRGFSIKFNGIDKIWSQFNSIGECSLIVKDFGISATRVSSYNEYSYFLSALGLGVKTGSFIGIGGDIGASDPKTRLYDGGWHILEQRYTTNAQTYRIYNTYTDASNYERATISWGSNLLTIGTEAAGTGSQRNLRLQRETGNYLQLTDLGLDATQTWNAAGITFTGLKLNVTDTASAAGSNLINLQIGGSSKFVVDKNGDLFNFRSITQGLSIYSQGYYHAQGPRQYFGYASAQLHSTCLFGWTSSMDAYGGTLDTYITREAAGIIAQRSAYAQTYRIYNTYTDASNYERGTISWGSNLLTIGTEAAGTGTARDLEFNVGGSKLHIKTDGTIYLDAAGQTVGNARGGGAVDLQATRTNATYVASGANAVALGNDCKASGAQSIAMGITCTASGSQSIALGRNNTASYFYSTALGNGCTASSLSFAWGSSCTASGDRSIAFGANTKAHNGSHFAFGDADGIGRAQANIQLLQTQTTDATATALRTLYTPTASYMTLEAKRACTIVGYITAFSDTYKMASWEIKCSIKRDASNVTSIVGTPEIIQTAADAEAISGLWDVLSVTADDTNEALAITVQGQAATNIRWQGTLIYGQVGY